jgi:hypothetical protein
VCRITKATPSKGPLWILSLVLTERVEDSYSIKAVSEDEKTFWWGCKGCNMMNCGHYVNQFKEKNVDFGIWRALMKLVNKTVVAVDK